MKKRRSILVALMLVAVMCIGIGYAAVSTVLNITGTATVTKDQAQAAFAENIYFKDVTHQDGNASTDIHTTLVADKKKITFSVNSLSSVGDSQSFTATIANKGTLDATIKVTASSVNTSAEYFEIITDWGTDTKTLAKAVNGTTPTTITIKVTIRLKAAPTDLINGDFSLALTATSVDA
jgi:type II secretory pathway pseudopilin PulG